MITDYIILSSTFKQTLENHVRDYIRAGWQPQGGLFIETIQNVMREHGGLVFYQAMVKHA